MSRKALILIGVILVVLALAPLASADNRTSQAGYGGEPAVQVTLVESATSSQQEPGSTLPITGLDLGLVVLGGSLLVLVGIGMKRLGRERR